MDLGELFSRAGVSGMAGRRYVNKLARRGWVMTDQKTCRLVKFKNRLGVALIDAV